MGSKEKSLIGTSVVEIYIGIVSFSVLKEASVVFRDVTLKVLPSTYAFLWLHKK